jgi:hypothetical protein
MLCILLKAFLLPRNSPTIYTTIHIDTLGVVSRSRETPFLIQQCLLPDWDILNEDLQVCLAILGTLRYNTSKAIKKSTKTLLRPLLYQQGSRCWQIQEIKKDTKTAHFPLAPFLPTTLVALVLNGLHITSNQINSHLSLWPITHLSYRPTWKKKHNWSEDTFFSINWLASNKEYKQLSTEHQ